MVSIVSLPVWLQDRKHATQACIALGIFTVLGAGWSLLRPKARFRRPYEIRDNAADVSDPKAELARIVEFLQDTVVRPLDARLPGNPFQADLTSFPFTPMVLVIGNHSAGKSTFINGLLGIQAQETGVAPTDDGFTVLERSRDRNEKEDGPTLLGCQENRPFRELQIFGQAFWGHLKRKRLKLPETSVMPYGLQIVDTPGMIDMPAQVGSMAGGRGYNFLEVVRWFAKRADLILLLFDPDRPGTTGETLEVLTKSLAGLDHKFIIVLNKVDQLDSNLDFARAYGTLGWALSKVISQKDMPLIYTMYNEFASTAHANPNETIHLEAFRRNRLEVMDEVYRSKSRHYDNIITGLEDLLRQVHMVARIMVTIRKHVWKRRAQVTTMCTLGMGLPSCIMAYFIKQRNLLTSQTVQAGGTFLALTTLITVRLAWDYCQQFEQLQSDHLDRYFEETYFEHFIHNDGEDLHGQWEVARPLVVNTLSSLGSAARLPVFEPWEIDWTEEVLRKDVWYLRQIAKVLRTGSYH